MSERTARDPGGIELMSPIPGVDSPWRADMKANGEGLDGVVFAGDHIGLTEVVEHALEELLQHSDRLIKILVDPTR